ncbi:uncharacterized protein LOC131302430 isoform X2 [Rhododendron vialii]|uniref:uncharacterized protein LOC131302430 isoform X2 n=1 Tax=Rhododendron vialii TaxID=182163 RepID=UPI00265D642D|nr:uncharacterized protein LOC131302430 isoform X2 [Rhododendron vialii]
MVFTSGSSLYRPLFNRSSILICIPRIRDSSSRKKTIAAVSYCRENNYGQITFKPDVKFMRDYGDLLELGGDLEYTIENDLVIWLEPLCRIHLCDIALLVLVVVGI